MECSLSLQLLPGTIFWGVEKQNKQIRTKQNKFDMRPQDVLPMPLNGSLRLTG